MKITDVDDLQEDFWAIDDVNPAEKDQVPGPEAEYSYFYGSYKSTLHN